MSICRRTWYVYYSKSARVEWLRVRMRSLRLWRRFAAKQLDVRHWILIAILFLFIIATLKSFSRDTVNQRVVEKLEAGYNKIHKSSECKSLLKKYLSKDTLGHLKYLQTPTHHSTLLDVVQSGFSNLDSGVGVYAPDAEAYETFADLFNPIIKEYHKGFSQHDKHPAPDFGDLGAFQNLDPEGKYIISTRIRGARSLKGFPFNPCLTEKQYREIEARMKSVLEGMSGELSGKYYPLAGMEKTTQLKLVEDHFLFKEGDRFLQAAAACRYWPVGRGIFHNADKNFLVWLNEEDHLRIISMQKGGDLGEVYRRWVSAVHEIERHVPFAHSARLGFLTFCPTNLGTTVRASVHIKLPKLAASSSKLKLVAESYNLQVRGTMGEHTESVSGVYDISNVRRMGLTEFQAVQEMQNGILELIKLEEAS